MVEYLHDAIKAAAGTDINILAIVKDEFGNEIKENVSLVIYDKESNRHLLHIDGVDAGESMLFQIPAELTKDFKGRHWYCIKHEDEQMCFLQPMYFV